jgi:hypothetical protein
LGEGLQRETRNGIAERMGTSAATFGGSTIVNYGSLPRGVPAVTTVSPTPFGGTRVVNYGYPGYGQPVGVAPSR